MEGVDYLPDMIKPAISQKAQEVALLIEPSEEVRLIIAEIVTLMVSSTMPDCFRAYLDDTVNILRSLCMDPYGKVI